MMPCNLGECWNQTSTSSQHLVSEVQTLYWDLKKVVTWWLVTLNTRMTCVFSVLPSCFPNISRVSPCPGAQLLSPVNPIDVIDIKFHKMNIITQNRWNLMWKLRDSPVFQPVFLSQQLTSCNCNRMLSAWLKSLQSRKVGWCHAMPMLCKDVQRSRSFEIDEKLGSTNMHAKQQVILLVATDFEQLPKTWQNDQTVYC